MSFKRSLCLILSVSLISLPTMSQTYITNTIDDPEIVNLKYDYTIWPEAPFRGVLVPTNKFKTIVGLASGAHALEHKGLDALPEKPSPITGNDYIYAGASGAIITITLCLIFRCRF